MLQIPPSNKSHFEENKLVCIKHDKTCFNILYFEENTITRIYTKRQQLQSCSTNFLGYLLNLQKELEL